MQSLLTYADINVAGFRKLLKQYGKQVPTQSRPQMSLNYREWIAPLIELASDFESLRTQLDELIQTLSPGAESLIELRIGTETAMAVGGAVHPELHDHIDMENKHGQNQVYGVLPDTASGTDVPRNQLDIFKVLESAGVDTKKLESQLISIKPN